MKIVIDMDEKDYNLYKIDDWNIPKCLRDALANGIPLPKGHGRLIDADETLKRHCTELCLYKPACEEDCVIYDLFHLAPTIIEADKAESEDKE